MSTDPYNLRGLDAEAVAVERKAKQSAPAPEHPNSGADGPGQPYGCGSRLDKDDPGDGIDRYVPEDKDSPKLSRRGVDGAPNPSVEEHRAMYPEHYARNEADSNEETLS